jgi:AraC-like DNA-binding protein
MAQSDQLLQNSNADFFHPAHPTLPRAQTSSETRGPGLNPLPMSARQRSEGSANVRDGKPVGDVINSAAIGRGQRAARTHAIKLDIVANLVRRDLSPATVAARVGISPRYARQLLAEAGTSFSEFVLMGRLTLAYRLLCDPRQAAKPISAVALDCGFGDLSYFNKSFRQRYGETPSDVRKTALRQGLDRTS